jgi:signal transduction histidine kinase
MPSLRWSGDALHTSLLVVAAAVLAMAAVAFSYDGRNLPLHVADGVVGFVILVSGVVAWERRRQTRVGPLMGFAGLAWFAGAFIPELRFLHRGPLVHLHLTYPTGRLTWWPVKGIVAIAYVVSLVEALTLNAAPTLTLSILVGVVAVAAFLRTSGTARHAGVPALLAALAFAGVLDLGVVNRVAGWRADRAVLWVYGAVVAGAVLVLLVDLVRGRWGEAVVRDLVVDLGGREDTGTLRDEMARALGDPSLVLGYWLAEEGRYVDDTGRAVDVGTPGQGRGVTAVEDGRGGPLAVLVHDEAVLDDPVLVRDVAAAARLAISNVRLKAQARERVSELAASRQRIVLAGDAQRRRIQGEIRNRVESHLGDAAALLRQLQAETNGSDREVLEELDGELTAARVELEDLAGGIHPTALTERGLAAALNTIQVPPSMRLDRKITHIRLPETVEAAVYFVCSEAVVNSVKHATATTVSVEVDVSDRLAEVTVTDDGVGGADPSRGSGLRGLVDRVEAMGGVIRIQSEPGAGTRITASLPTEEQTYDAATRS